jgi:hypothetical protein
VTAKPDDQYNDAETAIRMERALKRSLTTPPKPFTPKAKKKPSPDKAKAKKGG